MKDCTYWGTGTVHWYRYWYPGIGTGTLVQVLVPWYRYILYTGTGTVVPWYRNILYTVYRYRLGFQTRLIRDSPEISRLRGINGVQVIRVNQIKLFLH